MYKKLTGIALVLALSTSLVSCGGGAKKEVNNLLDAVMDLNIEKATKYLDEESFEEVESSFEDGIPKNLDEIIDFAIEESGEDSLNDYKKTIKGVAEEAHAKIKKEIKYTVKDAEKEDDITVCTVEIEMPTMEAIMEAVQNADTDKLQEIAEEVEDIEDLDKKTVDKLAKEAKNLIKDLKFEETDTFEVEIAMKKEGGKWVVSAEDCDFSDFMGMATGLSLLGM